jgi:agmatinase
MPTFNDYPDVTHSQGFDVAIVGAPYDQGTSGRAGAREAPGIISRATYMPHGLHCDLLDGQIDSDLNICDLGDLEPSPGGGSMSLHHAKEKLSLMLDNTVTRPIMIGGDHSMTWANFFATHNLYPQDQRWHMIVIDAHMDCWDPDKHVDHGNFLHPIMAQNMLETVHFVGTRGYAHGTDHIKFVLSNGGMIHSMETIAIDGLQKVVDRIIQECRHEYVYLSADIDAVDPAFAPGTGTPEPGGLTSIEFLALGRIFATNLNVRGADIMEVCPPYDHGDITSMLAHRYVCSVIHGMNYRAQQNHLHPARVPAHHRKRVPKKVAIRKRSNSGRT